MTQQQRNIKVSQALNDISRQTTRILHYFADSPYLCAFECHPSCHNQTYIAGAQNNYLLSRQVSFDVYQLLGRPRCEYSGRSGSRGAQRPAGLFPAAHGEYYGSRIYGKISLFLVGYGYPFFRRYINCHCVCQYGYSKAPDHLLTSQSVFGSCQLLLEFMESEAVVNTLLQYAAKPVFALYDYDLRSPRFLCGFCCAHSRRASSDYCHVCLHGICFVCCIHYFSPPVLVLPKVISEPSPDFVTCSKGIPSSSERISATDGIQKPP